MCSLSSWGVTPRAAPAREAGNRPRIAIRGRKNSKLVFRGDARRSDRRRQTRPPFLKPGAPFPSGRAGGRAKKRGPLPKVAAPRLDFSSLATRIIAQMFQKVNTQNPVARRKNSAGLARRPAPTGWRSDPGGPTAGAPRPRAPTGSRRPGRTAAPAGDDPPRGDGRGATPGPDA